MKRTSRRQKLHCFLVLIPSFYLLLCQDEQPEIQDKNLENDVFLPNNMGMEVPLNVDIEVPMNMDIQEPLNMDIDVPIIMVHGVSEQKEIGQEAGEPGNGEGPFDRPAARNDNETPTEVLRPLVLKVSFFK